MSRDKISHAGQVQKQYVEFASKFVVDKELSELQSLQQETLIRQQNMLANQQILINNAKQQAIELDTEATQEMMILEQRRLARAAAKQKRLEKNKQAKILKRLHQILKIINQIWEIIIQIMRIWMICLSKAYIKINIWKKYIMHNTLNTSSSHANNTTAQPRAVVIHRDLHGEQSTAATPSAPSSRLPQTRTTLMEGQNSCFMRQEYASQDKLQVSERIESTTPASFLRPASEVSLQHQKTLDSQGYREENVQTNVSKGFFSSSKTCCNKFCTKKRCIEPTSQRPS